jgi:hypothetical protein
MIRGCYKGKREREREVRTHAFKVVGGRPIVIKALAKLKMFPFSAK